MKNIFLPFNWQSSFGFWRGNFVLTLCGCSLTFFVCFSLLLRFLIFFWIFSFFRYISLYLFGSKFYLSDFNIVYLNSSDSSDEDSDSDESESEPDEKLGTEEKLDRLKQDSDLVEKAKLSTNPETKKESLAKLQGKYSKQLRGADNSEDFLQKVAEKICKETGLVQSEENITDSELREQEKENENLLNQKEESERLKREQGYGEKIAESHRLQRENLPTQRPKYLDAINARPLKRKREDDDDDDDSRNGPGPDAPAGPDVPSITVTDTSNDNSSRDNNGPSKVLSPIDFVIEKENNEIPSIFDLMGDD